MKKVIIYYDSKDSNNKDKIISSLSNKDLIFESSVITEEYENQINKIVENLKNFDLSIVLSDNYMYFTVKLNKFSNVRCSQCLSYVEAKYTRDHNNSNILSLGSNMLGIESILSICEIYCSKEFSTEEKHIRRVNKIEI